jgi:hypothetical protein
VNKGCVIALQQTGSTRIRRRSRPAEKRGFCYFDALRNRAQARLCGKVDDGVGEDVIVGVAQEPPCAPFRA